VSESECACGRRAVASVDQGARRSLEARRAGCQAGVRPPLAGDASTRRCEVEPTPGAVLSHMRRCIASGCCSDVARRGGVHGARCCEPQRRTASIMMRAEAWHRRKRAPLARPAARVRCGLFAAAGHGRRRVRCSGCMRLQLQRCSLSCRLGAPPWAADRPRVVASQRRSASKQQLQHQGDARRLRAEEVAGGTARQQERRRCTPAPRPAAQRSAALRRRACAASRRCSRRKGSQRADISKAQPRPEQHQSSRAQHQPNMQEPSAAVRHSAKGRARGQ
jgi:hypothetical protein